MDDIVNAYNNQNISQKEIALKFRVTVQLVRDLIRDSKKFPEKKRKMKEQPELTLKKREAIMQTI